MLRDHERCNIAQTEARGKLEITEQNSQAEARQRDERQYSLAFVPSSGLHGLHLIVTR